MVIGPRAIRNARFVGQRTNFNKELPWSFCAQRRRRRCVDHEGREGTRRNLLGSGYNSTFGADFRREKFGNIFGGIVMSFSGRVAFVTGASQGIGRACALKLATAGAAVAIAARNQEKLNELVSEITSAGGKAAAFALDVADEEQVKSAIKAAIAQFGKIDILVNNAGITRDQLVMRMKRADWDAVLQTNLTSAYLCIQQVSTTMLKQRWGRIINITSVFGQMGQAGQANYSASKAGLIGLTMAIARELGSRNITCNAVAPGFIETAMTEVLGDEFKQNAAKQIPLGRVGSVDDVANAVAFLASDEAAYITGHVLNVNGGMLMG
jgi:3-oxoacyl-[acyl-carrier protein] reductase